MAGKHSASANLALLPFAVTGLFSTCDPVCHGIFGGLLGISPVERLAHRPCSLQDPPGAASGIVVGVLGCTSATTWLEKLQIPQTISLCVISLRRENLTISSKMDVIYLFWSDLSTFVMMIAFVE